MDAQTAMSASAVKADKGAKFRRRLGDDIIHGQYSKRDREGKGFMIGDWM